MEIQTSSSVPSPHSTTSRAFLFYTGSVPPTHPHPICTVTDHPRHLWGNLTPASPRLGPTSMISQDTCSNTKRSSNPAGSTPFRVPPLGIAVSSFVLHQRSHGMPPPPLQLLPSPLPLPLHLPFPGPQPCFHSIHLASSYPSFKALPSPGPLRRPSDTHPTPCPRWAGHALPCCYQTSYQ